MAARPALSIACGASFQYAGFNVSRLHGFEYPRLVSAAVKALSWITPSPGSTRSSSSISLGGLFGASVRWTGVRVPQQKPVNGERIQRLAAAGVPVTGVENEVNAIDAVDGLGRDLRRVDRAVAKAQELESDPDAQPVRAVTGELERVARRRDGPARFEPRRSWRDRQQVGRAEVLADL